MNRAPAIYCLAVQAGLTLQRPARSIRPSGPARPTSPLMTAVVARCPSPAFDALRCPYWFRGRLRSLPFVA
eukprot:5756197-Pyramimonas_sp.AAC.1